MAIRLSTGLRNGMLDDTGMKEAMADGIIEIYSGAQPANADAAVQGTKLMEITVDAGSFTPGTATNGLEFGDPANGTVAKAAAETWRGVGLADGVAGWFRMKGNATDTGGISTTLPRIDGTIAKTGGDMSISNVNIVTGQPNTVDVFQFTLPSGA